MKKWIALLLAAVLLLSILAGCAKDAGQSGTNNGDQSEPGGNNPGGSTSGKPNASKDDDEVQVPTGFGYKVEYLPLEMAEEVSYINRMTISGETIFFMAEVITGKETSSYIDAEGNEVSYEYNVYESLPYRMDLDGSNVQPLPGYTPPAKEEGQEAYTYIEGIYADGQGGIYLMESHSVSIFELPEDFDPATGNKWDYWVRDESSMKLLQFNAAGEMIGERKIITSNEEGTYYYNYMLDAEGNLFCTDGQNIYAFGADGSQIMKLENEEYVELMKLGDAGIYVSQWKENSRTLRKVDLATGSLGEEMTLGGTAYNAWSCYPGFGDYMFLYNYNGVIYGYLEAQQTGEQVLNWIDCDINSNNVSNFNFLSDGRVLALEYQYDQTTQKNAYSMNVLTRVPKSELPIETEITLACMYLDYDLRARIVDFNKRTEGVRIVVKDYSEFNTQEDYTAGLTKLSTEILSGKVPDILVTSELPISQYAGKGILTDLWTLIDADAELSRDDLMSEVFEAMSIDGKLYYVTNSFSIATVAGHSGLVGDEIGWTLDELLAAKAELPPEATIFGDGDTKSGILTQVLQQNLSSFIDWQTMTCSFDSEAFIDILEFANTFPLEFNWEDYDYSVYESEYARLNSGKQMLQRYWLYSFSDYMYLDAMFGGNANCIGYPSANGNGNVFNVSTGLAISSTCKEIDAAWAFVRELLLEENQDNGNVWQFPTNRNVFNKMAEEMMTPQYETDPETGEKVEIPWSSYWIDSETTIDIMSLSQEQYDDFMEVYYSCKTVSGSNTKIMEIINDEVQAYFNGQKPAAEIARTLQSRIGLYLAEQG